MFDVNSEESFYDQFKEVCILFGIQEPLAQMVLYSDGIDPRSDKSAILSYIERIGPNRTPTIEEWSDICTIIMDNPCYYKNMVPMEISFKASQELLRHAIPKQKQLEIRNKVSRGAIDFNDLNQAREILKRLEIVESEENND